MEADGTPTKSPRHTCAYIPTRVNKTPHFVFTYHANRAAMRFQNMARRLLKPL
jgi:hypothetical protein